ncbi:MAG: LuxR C-terminal-related transcriptional regulator [Spirochaetia bacterium]|nr:LuxR C-terminal-related transcriptional regulator [Spirochaetia bacterium]
MDYLVEEVINILPEKIQKFLLHTSILNRMCVSLCDAIIQDSSVSAEEITEYLENTNLFIIPLDNERQWFRYHYLFADLLRQRLKFTNSSDRANNINVLHIKASEWFEKNGFELEAFNHAVLADDIDLAARLSGGNGIALHTRGALLPVLNWLKSLSQAELDKRPFLWIQYAGALMTAGQTNLVEEKLQAAEAVLKDADLNTINKDMMGRIAATRASLAVSRYDTVTVMNEAKRALEYLDSKNLPIRGLTTWALANAQMLQDERKAAIESFSNAISISQKTGHYFVEKISTIGLASTYELENKLHLAFITAKNALDLFGDEPLPIACEAHLVLSHIYYQLNDLENAQKYAKQALKLARQFPIVIDRYISCEVFLARIKIAQGNTEEAGNMLNVAFQTARRENYKFTLPEVIDAQILVYLHQKKIKAASNLLKIINLPLSKARIFLAEKNHIESIKTLELYKKQTEEKNLANENLKTLILLALAYKADNKIEKALKAIEEALSLAEPEDYIRIFIDEGLEMKSLLSEAATQGIMPDYVKKLLCAFQSKGKTDFNNLIKHQSLPEQLSERELEVLRMIEKGMSNQEISERLFLALDTIKGYNRNIFGKLEVKRRTEAVARARELKLL